MKKLKKHRKCYLGSEKPLEGGACTCPIETQNEISKICRTIFNLAEAGDPDPNYKPFPVFSDHQASYAVKKLGFSASNFFNYSNEILLSNENELLMMGGYSQKDGLVLFWLVDGEMDYRINHYHCKDDGLNTFEKTLLYSYATFQIHINWGKAGNGNGWFSKGVFSIPAEAQLAENSSTTIGEVQFMRIRKPNI